MVPLSFLNPARSSVNFRFTIHILPKPNLKDSVHNLASMPARTDQDRLEEYTDNKMTWSSHPLLVTYHTFQELGVGFRRQRKPGITCLPLSHLFSLIFLDSPRLASNALQGITSLVFLISFYSLAFICTDLLRLLGTPSLTALPSSFC